MHLSLALPPPSTSARSCHQSPTLPPCSAALTPSRRPSILALINLPSPRRPHSRCRTSQLFLLALTTPFSRPLSASPALRCSRHQSCIQLTHCQSGPFSPLRPPTWDINLYQLSSLSKLDKRQTTLCALRLCPHVFRLSSHFFSLHLSALTLSFGLCYTYIMVFIPSIHLPVLPLILPPFTPFFMFFVLFPILCFHFILVFLNLIGLFMLF